MRLRTTQLVSIGGLAVLATLLQLAASTLSAATGIVWAEGIIGVVVINAFFVLTPLLLRRFWATTIMGLIFGLLTLPLFAFGPPGFLPKVPANALAGLVADVAYVLTPQLPKILRAFLIGFFVQFFTGFMFYAAGFLFASSSILTNTPKAFTSPAGLAIGVLISAVLGGFGGLIAHLAYSKVKDSAVVRRIQA